MAIFMRDFNRLALTALLLVAAACGSSTPDEEPSGDTSPAPPPPPSAPTLAPAPWSAPRLPRSGVPSVYVTEWEKAENRSTCALIAPEALGDGTGATPRRANFSGGWAVAYDQPGLRSAFGVAGAGTTPDSTTFDGWPHKVKWADSSGAGYGPEGGSGPNQLAFLRIAGQQCLYNIWSRIGIPHLEYLLSQLRYVE
jgi:hypothetical protein